MNHSIQFYKGTLHFSCPCMYNGNERTARLLVNGTTSQAVTIFVRRIVNFTTSSGLMITA